MSFPRRRPLSLSLLASPREEALPQHPNKTDQAEACQDRNDC